MTGRVEQRNGFAKVRLHVGGEAGLIKPRKRPMNRGQRPAETGLGRCGFARDVQSMFVMAHSN